MQRWRRKCETSFRGSTCGAESEGNAQAKTEEKPQTKEPHAEPKAKATPKPRQRRNPKAKAPPPEARHPPLLFEKPASSQAAQAPPAKVPPPESSTQPALTNDTLVKAPRKRAKAKAPPTKGCAAAQSSSADTAYEDARMRASPDFPYVITICHMKLTRNDPEYFKYKHRVILKWFL